MGKVIEYKFLPEASVDSTQTCPIEITSGQFTGIVYRYGKIDFKEDGSDGLNVTMEIEMIKSPTGFDKEDKQFTQTVGEIFVKIVEAQVEVDNGKDLEADVHEDHIDNA
jgi:hypothetical protein